MSGGLAAPGGREDPLLSLLRDRFGHQEFLPPQRAVVAQLLAGGDALLVMPTGGGKSLCWQLPALALEGTTICLSPLIALMQDQVDRLRERGIEATFVNSSLQRKERERRLEALAEGRYRILYVTPERFRSEPFLAALRHVRVPLLAVDEAHCISAWGHDFRPEYGRVGAIRAQLGDPPTIALTATATPSTQADIRERLRIEDAPLFHAGIERANLRIGVLPVADEDAAVDRLHELLSALRGPGIVYFALIQQLERARERLARRGLQAAVYHGDLPAARRRSVQQEFLRATDGVLLATNAFGLGVDKPDIRFIVHAQLPGSLEAYVQEIGRAGRDGRDAACALLYRSEDVLVQKQFVEWANPDAAFVRGVVAQLERWGDTLHARELDDLRQALLLKNRSDGRPEMVLAALRAQGIVAGSFEGHDLLVLRPLESGEAERLVPPDKRGRDLERLLDLVRWSSSEECRKRGIHAYFGFPAAPEWRCGACDVCVGEAGVLAGLERGPEQALRAPSPDPAAVDEAPVRVGDWLRIDGRHVVVVRRVLPGNAGSLRIEAESAGDFRLRAYDLQRIPWEPIEKDR